MTEFKPFKEIYRGTSNIEERFTLDNFRKLMESLEFRVVKGEDPLYNEGFSFKRQGDVESRENTLLYHFNGWKTLDEEILITYFSVHIVNENNKPSEQICAIVKAYYPPGEKYESKAKDIVDKIRNITKEDSKTLQL